MLLLAVLFLYVVGCKAHCAIEPDSYGHVDIPSDWYTIGGNYVDQGAVFEECLTLKTLTIPDKVYWIGYYAFRNCVNLESVSLGVNSQLRTIDYSAFWGTLKLREFYFPNGLKSLVDMCFRATGLQSVTIPQGVTSIEDGAFAQNFNMSEIIISDGTSTSIGKYAFYFNTNISSIQLGNAITRIEESAFFGVGISSSGIDHLVIPESVTEIKELAFSQSAVKKVSMVYSGSSSEVTIGKSAFYNCPMLVEVTLSVSHVTLGELAFSDSPALTSFTFSSQNITFDNAAFGGCPKLDAKDVRYIKSLVQVTNAKNAGGVISVSCLGGTCGCNAGFGNTLGDDSDYFNCVACEAGKASVQLSRICEPCGPGTYSVKTSTVWTCKACQAGKYNMMSGSSSESDCLACPKGTYAPALGSIECLVCPAGTYCPDFGTVTYAECEEGHYSDKTGQTACSPCPAGRYQMSTGQPVCSSCGMGNYSTAVAAESASVCQYCPPGKYGGSMGLVECSDCVQGQFQDGLGQTQCKDCSQAEGEYYTSNEDHTACEDISFLSHSFASLVKELFSRGVALGITFTCAVAFAALAVAVHRNHVDLVSLLRRQALSAAFTGLSFGSELFSIIGVLNSAPTLAAVMLSFRLLHFVAGGMIATLSYGSSTVGDSMQCVLGDSQEVRGRVDRKWSGRHISLLVLVVLASMCDVTMVKVLPWRASDFVTASGGFPTLTVLQFCLGIDGVQSLVTVVCQLVFLVRDSHLDDPTVTAQTKAIFFMSIVSSVVGLGMSALRLCLQRELLVDADIHAVNDDKRKSAAGDVAIEMGVAPIEGRSGVMPGGSVGDDGGDVLSPIHGDDGGISSFADDLFSLSQAELRSRAKSKEDEISVMKERLESQRKRIGELEEESALCL